MLAAALEAEMKRSAEARINLFVREAANRHAETIRDERDQLLRKVSHLEDRIEAMRAELKAAIDV